MKTMTRLFFYCFILFVSACSSSPDLSSSSQPSSELSFVDIGKFDKYLSASLTYKYDAVDVYFYQKVSPNQIPERLQKWISSVEQSGGRVSVEPPKGEVTPKDPFTIIGLIASMIGGAKNFAEFKTNKTYSAAKDRDAQISLERNGSGEVVVSKVHFAKRHTKENDKK